MATARQQQVLGRRAFLGIGAGAVLTVLTACGSGDPAPTASAAGPAGGPFPVTVPDRFGSVTIESAPATVVSLGRTDHDVLLALGIVPAGVFQFLPTMTRGVGVWAEDRLGTATPALFTSTIDVERVASLRPDLILNVQSLGDEALHSQLVKIATTVDLPPGAAPNAVPWQTSTEIISTAVGRKSDGAALLEQTRAGLAAKAAEHPESAGRSVSVLLTYGDQIGVYTTADTRMQVVTALGLVPSGYVSGLGAEKYFVELSPERIPDVDADAVVVLTREGLTESDLLARFPTIAGSRASAEGRLLVVEDLNVSLALSAASVLSIPFAVDGLLPLLTRRFG